MIGVAVILVRCFCESERIVCYDASCVCSMFLMITCSRAVSVSLAFHWWTGNMKLWKTDAACQTTAISTCMQPATTCISAMSCRVADVVRAGG